MKNDLTATAAFVIGGKMVDGQIEVKSPRYPGKAIVVGFDDSTIVVSVVFAGSYDVVYEVQDGVHDNFDLATIIDAFVASFLY